MAKIIENTYRNKPKISGEQNFGKILTSILLDERIRLMLGIASLLASFALLIALSSYFFTGKADQSIVEAAFNTDIKTSGAEVENWLGLSGAIIAHILVFRWFGIASFILVPVLFFIGWKMAFKTEVFPIRKTIYFALFFLVWTSFSLGYWYENNESVNFWSGGFGYEFAVIMQSLIGVGTSLFIVFALFIFVVNFFNLEEINRQFFAGTAQAKNYFELVKNTVNQQVSKTKKAFYQEHEEEVDEIEEDEFLKQGFDRVKKEKFEETFEKNQNLDIRKETIPLYKNMQKTPNTKLDLELEITKDEVKENKIPLEIENKEKSNIANIQNDLDFEHDIDTLFEVGDTVNEGEEYSIENLGAYDPTLDLGHYQKPTLDLLDDIPTGKRQVTNEELEANKDRIVETLSNYGIGISQIKATIGPTVTLYEIIPEAGVRISKIKNLEDDIALSLAALGIRIIAPIPGKGTIGIEVPNKRREVVPMRNVLNDEAFTNSEKDLPIILGKTISNEVYVADLAKMPHLLIAGATGQGKSVGLNTFMISLIYKKHPAELKFVLVDPKKVEMTLFNTIEKHFLAKLPGEKDAIITDNKKVVSTLNSLCVEMENRYNLLKEASCRNLKEYNKKFLQRRLNPRKGHRFMPYIVLIIDELADLMMTAGKEVEQPIARLAQLARAIGIHLIVATQRPSVNVITGIIKANFPARLSFKVTSKIDSRTILDTGGAEQLVGMGDMLFTMGAESVRLQGAFLDTHEVERICAFIGSQQGYPMAYELPEFLSEDEKMQQMEEDDEINFEKDSLFEEAARIIVMHQQGSTSLLQRRLKLGYNRAGRLIDQLEKAGIVGPFEGSKAREVLVPDEYSLERLLNGMNK